MNMIERVARAMCKSDDPENDWNSKAMSDYSRNAWRVYAKAAIEAMKEPTDEMHKYFMLNDLRIYKEVIDAALKEE